MHTGLQNQTVGTGVKKKTDLRSEFCHSPTIPCATFVLKQVFERASRAIARFTGSQDPTVGTGVINRRTFGPSFVTPPLCIVPLLLQNKYCACCARRIAKSNCGYWHLKQTDLRSEFCHYALPHLALKRVFERYSRAIARAARTGSQNPTVGTGVLNRRTFGPSFVTLPLCLAPLLL